MPGGGGGGAGSDVVVRWRTGGALTDEMHAAAPPTSGHRCPAKIGRERHSYLSASPSAHPLPPSSYIVSANDGDEMRQFFG